MSFEGYRGRVSNIDPATNKDSRENISVSFDVLDQDAIPKKTFCRSDLVLLAEDSSKTICAKCGEETTFEQEAEVILCDGDCGNEVSNWVVFSPRLLRYRGEI